MPLRDVLAAALSRPAGKVVDGPVRDIVNEILSERGYASPAEVAALRAEADTLRTQLQAVEARAEAIEARLAELAEAVVRAPSPSSSPALPSPSAPTRTLVPDVPAPPEAASEERQRWAADAVQRGTCRVMGCERAARRDGFCVAHSEAWKAGQLGGFVSPEGLVRVGDQPRRVAPGLAGRLYAVDGDIVLIDGESVAAVAY